MENTRRYYYCIAKNRLLRMALFFTLMGLGALWMMNSGAKAEAEAWKMIWVGVPTLIYFVVTFARIGLSEKSVYLSDIDVTVPQANRYALPSLTKRYTNIRIPFDAVDFVFTSSRHNQEYLHIQFDDKNTTVVSSMFKSDAEFYKFKTRLYERLDIDESE